MKTGSTMRLLPLRSLGPCVLLLLQSWVAGLSGQPVGARIEPASASVNPGSAVTLCVQATGIGPLRYQWQKNGVNLVAQTNQCLSFDSAAVSDGGSYRAIVSDAGGVAQTDEAELQVRVSVVPGADQFDYGTVILAVSNSVEGVSLDSTRDPGEPLHLGLSTSNSVWYAWRAPASGIVTFDTRGSGIDTVLGVYVGDSLGTLKEVGGDDEDGGFHTSRVSWNAETGRVYRVVIDGVTGETGRYVCNWNLEETADRLPVITRKPVSQTVPPGGTARFLAAVVDPDPKPHYQWFRNGIPIGGAQAPELVISNVQSADLGAYRLAVTNASGRGVLTAPVDLEIGPDPEVRSRDRIADIPSAGSGAGAPPPVQLMGLGSSGTFSLSAGTLINHRFFNTGTTDRCEPPHCGIAGGASRWFQLVAESDGICTVDTAGSDVDTILAVYLQNFGICTQLYEPLVDCNNDVLGGCQQILGPAGSLERSSRVSFSAIKGTVYRAVVDTVGGRRGTNIQFNVRYETSQLFPTNRVELEGAARSLLQFRGGNLTLVAAPRSGVSNQVYRWEVNGRTIAGALRNQLSLPFLNYSDAGLYRVTLLEGTNRVALGEANVSVISPCQEEGFQLLGSASATVVLEASASLAPTSSWRVVRSILPSAEPVLWNVSTGSSLFYRVVSPPR